MKCPYCQSENLKVIDSRDGKDGKSIRRRRECLECLKRFSTIESIIKLDLQVRKNSGEIEDFNIEKIKNGILKACKKRPVTLKDIDKLTDSILNELKKESYENNIINSEHIGKVVSKYLKKLDEIAFIRFSLVYKNYNSVNEFLKDIKKELKINIIKID